jgi:hypothetical protein
MIDELDVPILSWLNFLFFFYKQKINYKEYKMNSTLTIQKEYNYMFWKQSRELLHQSEKTKIALFPIGLMNQNHLI